MQKFNITGMSCAACVARVEGAVSSLDGVTNCSVNLLTATMNVEGTAGDTEIINAVTSAGYGATIMDEKSPIDEDLFKDKETPLLLKRLIISLVFLVPLMYFSMGGHFGLIPSFLADKYLILAFLQMALSLTLIIINKKFFINGIKGILGGSANMDTLVSLGSGVSFGYSLVMLILMCVNASDTEFLSNTLHNGLYFESAGMILVLITVGKSLEAFSKGKTKNALKSLIKLKPKNAILLVDGKEELVPIEEINEGDIFVVKAGGIVPVDGIILEGEGAFDESALTGESVPSDKGVGKKVFASSINTSGYVIAKASEVGEKTALAKIIKTVTDAVATKAPIAKIADTVSGFFVPVVIVIAIFTTGTWAICGTDLAYSLERGICVLVISCPCALGLATPVAIMVGSGKGAKKGVLFKDAAKLEALGSCDAVLLDKTGTITSGKPEVTDVISLSVDKDTLVSYAYTLEKMSEHPLAIAVNTYAVENGASLLERSDFKTLSGSGVSAMINGEMVFGASYTYTSRALGEREDLKSHFEKLANEGKTPLFFVKGDTPLGIIAVRDKIKDDSRDAILELKKMGLYVAIITGDNEKTAKAVASEVGADDVFYEVMPDGKSSIVNQTKKQARTIMVGDGINDSPALASADVGVAIGSGTDIAIDTADVVLANSRLSTLVTAIKLSRATIKNIKGNLFWAFIYNIIGIPLAAGVFIAVSGGALTLSPMLGSLFMSLSSVSVVLNALSLNLFDEKRHYSKKRKITGIKREKNTMEITLKVEGMMCPHCEARVKSVLEALDGVVQAIPSHQNGEVKIELSGEVPVDTLKSTIEAQGYKVN